MPKRRLAALSCLFAMPFALAQAPSDVASLDKIFAAWNADTPGCAVGVAQGGKPVLAKAYGMADLEHGARNAADTIFEAGSVSKQFTAAAVALLAREGKLSLDDPVRKYLPEVPDYGAPLTIRHMLNHTSGLRDWGSVAEIGGSARATRVYTPPQVLEIVAHQSALNFTPGTRWSYSNTGYSLAAIIVECVSGMSFQRFSRERIFAPLGMDHTSWRDDYTRVLKDRAIAYDKQADGYHTQMPFENVVGNGGLLTTVGDLLKWNQNFATPVVGDAAFVAAQQQPGKFNDGTAHNYALGLEIDTYKGVPVVMHTGATAGYRSSLDRFPDQQLSVAVLCNAGNANAPRAAMQVAELFLPGAALQPSAPMSAGQPGPGWLAVPARAADGPLSELAGTYTSEDAEASYAVAEEGGALVAHGRYGVKLPLTRVGGDRFRVGPERVQFRRDAQGKVIGLSVIDDRVWDLRFVRKL